MPYLPEVKFFNRLYDEGGEGGGTGESQGDGTPAEGSDAGSDDSNVPDKFKGKSTEDVIKSYQELETQLGSKRR